MIGGDCAPSVGIFKRAISPNASKRIPRFKILLASVNNRLISGINLNKRIILRNGVLIKIDSLNGGGHLLNFDLPLILIYQEFSLIKAPFYAK